MRPLCISEPKNDLGKTVWLKFEVTNEVTDGKNWKKSSVFKGFRRQGVKSTVWKRQDVRPSSPSVKKLLFPRKTSVFRGFSFLKVGSTDSGMSICAWNSVAIYSGLDEFWTQYLGLLWGYGPVWGYKWGYGDFRFSELFEAICALLFQLRKGFKMLWKNWKVEFRFLRDRIDYQTVSCCVVIWRSTIARRQDTANVKEIGSGTFHSRPVVLVSVR